jgi:predicted nuclease of predicted toxin-antitoxin system
VKLLLDENLPHRLRHLLPGHDVFTVTFMRWDGIENGKLLALAASEGFDALLTRDLSMQYEQNIVQIPLAIIVFEAKSNLINDITPLVPELLRQLPMLKPCTIVRIR